MTKPKHPTQEKIKPKELTLNHNKVEKILKHIHKYPKTLVWRKNEEKTKKNVEKKKAQKEKNKLEKTTLKP